MNKRKNKVQKLKIVIGIVCLLGVLIINLKSGSSTLNKLYYLGLVFLYFFITKVYKYYVERSLIKASMKKVDSMSGEEFEDFLQVHFSKQGYKASLTPKTADYGADLVLKKNKEKIVVQAKRWKNRVGVEAVQQAVASTAYYKADRAMVVTNSYFTENAKALAKANKVELWDRNSLVDLINKNNLVNERCPKCKGELVKRTGMYGDFLGCANYPKCNFTKGI